jgi:hypothetical protein
MGRTCSTNGEKRNVYRLLVGKPEEIEHWEHQDLSGWIVLKWILERERERERGWGCMGWIDVAQDRDKWRALVNTC